MQSIAQRRASELSCWSLRVRLWPPENQDLPDTMYRHRVETRSERLTQRDALLAIRGRNADLDEFVRGERAVGLFDELVREACVADADDRFERVRPGFQLSPFTGGERGRHPSIVVPRGFA